MYSYVLPAVEEATTDCSSITLPTKKPEQSWSLIMQNEVLSVAPPV